MLKFERKRTTSDFAVNRNSFYPRSSNLSHPTAGAVGSPSAGWKLWVHWGGTSWGLHRGRLGHVSCHLHRERCPTGDSLVLGLLALATHPVIQEARQVTEVSFPGGTDCCSFFLDDGFCDGTALAVPCFLASLVDRFRRIGLEINLDKTEVIPPWTSLGPSDFPGCCWTVSASFKLLGAAIGPVGWCEDLLGRRVAKARGLLTAIGLSQDLLPSFGLR